MYYTTNLHIIYTLFPVHKVFENVANKYDVMNDLMSGFVHRAWKDHFVSRLQPRPYTRLLDVAGGTGEGSGCVVLWWGSVLVI